MWYSSVARKRRIREEAEVEDASGNTSRTRERRDACVGTREEAAEEKEVEEEEEDDDDEWEEEEEEDVALAAALVEEEEEELDGTTARGSAANLCSIPYSS